MTATHRHRAGMTYYTHPRYHTFSEITPMHIFAAWDDVTNQGRGVFVSGYDPKVPAAMKPIQPGTKFTIPKIVKKLGETGSALMAARYAANQAMAEAKRVGLAALAAGITEVDVATSLGVDRMTVRKWAGK